MEVPFNRPPVTGRELDYLREVLASRHLAGDGAFSRRCHAALVEMTGSPAALLTHSCTGALEMAALLCDLGPGDEVIMPSFTFVSTANAVVLRGAVPVFVDIRPDTLNLDERRIEEALTDRTRAIFAVHYAGVGCEMEAILDIARRRSLMVVEDAAQGLLASYKGRMLGAMGDLGALSFHETKNVVAGEGGALLINRPDLALRAEIIREKGTNRTSFHRHEVDKYTWVDIGSSYLPGELTAACLLAQLEQADETTAERLRIWERYHAMFEAAEGEGRLRRPIVPGHCRHNGHIYYLLLPTADLRGRLIAALKAAGIGAPFHYVPLDSAPAGRRFGRAAGDLSVTHDVANRLIRLPLWPGMEQHAVMVAERVLQILDASALAAAQ